MSWAACMCVCMYASNFLLFRSTLPDPQGSGQVLTNPTSIEVGKEVPRHSQYGLIQLGSLASRAYPDTEPERPKTSSTSVPSEGPHAVRVCRETNPVVFSTVQTATSSPPRRASICVRLEIQEKDKDRS